MDPSRLAGMLCSGRTARLVATFGVISIAATACGDDSDGGVALSSDEPATEVGGVPDPTEPDGAGTKIDTDDASSGSTSDLAGDVANPAAELLGFTAEALDGDPVDVGQFVGRDLVVWFWEPH